MCLERSERNGNNYEKYRLKIAPGKYEKRNDAVSDPHSYSVYYKEIINTWKKRGLHYHAYRIGSLCWITMIPESVAKREVRKPRILVVQCSVDHSDERYAMDMLEHFEQYNQQAADQGIILLYTATNVPDKDNLLPAALLELGSIFHVELDNLYLDVSPVYLSKKCLGDIDEFIYSDDNGERLNPDKKVEYFGQIPVLNIRNRWQSKVSNLYGTASATRSSSDDFDLNRHIHSICGKKMAEAMRLEHSYKDAMDPELLSYWESIGARYEQHEKSGQRWVSLVPLNALEYTTEKFPVLMVFRETSQNDSFLPLIGFGGYYGYCDIVAQGDLIILMFAMETPEDNELFYDILQDAAKIYPIDLTRVYVTGHSHNGYYACDFMRKHHREIAGVATQGNRNGLYGPGYAGPPRVVSDEDIELMTTFDIPTINFCGTAENDYTRLDINSNAYANMIDAFQRRLKAHRCPMKDYKEIEEARTSSDYATRKIGVPVDRSEVIYMFGSECYCGYIKNLEGKEYLKLVVVDNLPHITIPQMCELSWSFLRRFARNLETGELIELY